MQKLKKLEQIDFLAGLVGGMMLIVHWLIIATLPDFFFISPAGENSQLRRAELVLSTLGWICTSTVAPISLFAYAAGYRKARSVLLYAALVWPISLVISQVTVYILDGSFYLDYLIKFPVFIYTDLVLPIFIIFLWHDLKDRDEEDEEGVIR